MKINYSPKSQAEKFGKVIYNLLVENFPQTYFVGGLVRDLLLKKNVNDIDIATSATPQQVRSLLQKHKINYSDAYRRFGVIYACQDNLTVEIASLRTENYQSTRYPKINLTKSAKTDSLRRDFTINAFYLKEKTGQILDFHQGARDLKQKLIRIIGDPDVKFRQDPLRIIRALRFAVDLKFKIEEHTFEAIYKNFKLINNLTESKIKTELSKIKNQKGKEKILKVLKNRALLDKYF